MLDKNVSNRLALLRFPTIMGILFIHSATTTMHTAEGISGSVHTSSLVSLVKYCIGQQICAPAVPLLFLISGFLFFNDFRFSWTAYAEKLKKRTKTLLIPFAFWNCAVLMLYFVGESLSITRKYFAGNPQWPLVKCFSWFDYLRAFGLGSIYPVAYQFWYVRDLIVMVLLVPLISILVRGRVAIPFLICAAAFWATEASPLSWPSAGVIFFFSFGAYLSSNKKDVRALDSKGWRIGVLLFFPLLIVDAMSRQSAFHGIVHKGVIIAGIVMTWWLSNRVAEWCTVRKWLISLSSASFFVFAAHEPLMMILRRLSLNALAHHSDIATLGYFFATPFILAGSLVLVYRGLDAYAPSVLAVVAGGRNESKSGHSRRIREFASANHL